MQSTPNTFRHWHMPKSHEVGNNHVEFIKILQGPTWITIEGKDNSRQRAIVTLLHGNEPSGLKAIHRFLQEEITPATNLGIFIVSVNAALLQPYFSHRYLPDETDFNRCFPNTLNNKSSNAQELLAIKIIDTLLEYEPEAIVDTHNTSAHSDAFAVAVSSRKEVLQLSQLFTNKLVVLDQELGTLIEQDLNCPVVTIEFGGFLDPKADTLALDTLQNFVSSDSLFNAAISQIQLLEKPLRLEISKSAHLHYSASVHDEADITIYNTIDQMNFSLIKADTAIGWAGKNGIKDLFVKAVNGKNSCPELFLEQNGFLTTRVPMTIFMATTDAHIASNDCLMYLCPEDGIERIESSFDESE